MDDLTIKLDEFMILVHRQVSFGLGTCQMCCVLIVQMAFLCVPRPLFLLDYCLWEESDFSHLFMFHSACDTATYRSFKIKPTLRELYSVWCTFVVIKLKRCNFRLSENTREAELWGKPAAHAKTK